MESHASRRLQVDVSGSRAADATAPRRAVPRPRWTHVSILLSLCSIAFGLLVWELLSRSQAVDDYMLPSPSTVAHEWWTIAQTGLLWRHVSATLKEAGLGFLIGFGFAALIGYPLAKSRVLTSLLSPYIAGIQAMPMLALAPLLIVWFGLGLTSKVLICALIVFFPMLVNIAVGLRRVDRSLVEAASTEGAGWWSSLWRIEAPLAAPTILAGVRMGITLAMTGAIVAEFVASDRGLGYLMMFARTEYNSPLLFAAAITMVGIAVAAYLCVGLLEHVLIDWD